MKIMREQNKRTLNPLPFGDFCPVVCCCWNAVPSRSFSPFTDSMDVDDMGLVRRMNTSETTAMTTTQDVTDDDDAA